MSNSDVPFFYCPAHQLRFRPASETTILCQQGSHELGNGFPDQSWWTYCCDCATFWPDEFTKGAVPSKQCLVCDRVTEKRFLCTVCQVVSIESSELIHRKTHAIRQNGIEPGCPACKTAGPARAVDHDCPEIGLKFLSARSTCPFCQQAIGSGSRPADVPGTNVRCWSCFTKLVAPFKFCKRCGKAQNQSATTPVAIATTTTVSKSDPIEPTVTESESDDSESRVSSDTLSEVTLTDASEPEVSELLADSGFESTYSPSWQTTKATPPRRRAPWSLALVAVVVCVGILLPVFALYGDRKKESKPLPPPASPPGMVYVAGGEFLMGTDDGDEYERPAHKASVGPFYMDVTEVTCEMYQEFVKATGHRVPAPWVNNSYPAGTGKLPVTGVDWYDAEAYAKWAEKRLPTEEEWEFAARSNDGRRYPWGNTWSSGAANAGDSSAQKVVNVGSFPTGKTPSGLTDLAGNAWEWTSSDLVAYPNGNLPDKLSGEIKVIRGGSWQGTTSQITTTYRGYLLASGGDDYSATGFRCVRNTPAISPSQ